jgi:hypothetical protein
VGRARAARYTHSPAPGGARAARPAIRHVATSSIQSIRVCAAGLGSGGPGSAGPALLQGARSARHPTSAGALACEGSHAVQAWSVGAPSPTRAPPPGGARAARPAIRHVATSSIQSIRVCAAGLGSGGPGSAGPALLQGARSATHSTSGGALACEGSHAVQAWSVGAPSPTRAPPPGGARAARPAIRHVATSPRRSIPVGPGVDRTARAPAARTASVRVYGISGADRLPDMTSPSSSINDDTVSQSFSLAALRSSAVRSTTSCWPSGSRASNWSQL